MPKPTRPQRKAVWVSPEAHAALRLLAARTNDDIGKMADRAILSWVIKTELRLNAKQRSA